MEVAYAVIGISIGLFLGSTLISDVFREFRSKPVGTINVVMDDLDGTYLFANLDIPIEQIAKLNEAVFTIRVTHSRK